MGQGPAPQPIASLCFLQYIRLSSNTVQLGKTGTDTNFLPLEIGCLSQRFAALTEQYWA
jgi:hypothetical protein